MFTRFSLAFVTVLGVTAWNAHAEREVGTGGAGLVCYDAAGQVKSVEVYDYFEAAVLRRAKIDLGDPSLTYLEQAEVALKRLERLSPLRAQRYRQEVAEFEANATFLDPGISLPLIPDTGAVQMPDGCHLAQAQSHHADAHPNVGNLRHRQAI